MAKKSAAKKKTAARTPAPKRAVKAAARSKKAPARKAPARKAAAAARKPAGKVAKKAAKKAVKKAVKKPAGKVFKKTAAARKAAPKKVLVRKVAAKKAPARKAAARPAVVRRANPKAAPKAASKATVAAKPAGKTAAARTTAPARHMPAIERERRTVAESSPTAPSSLVSNRHASAASSGADELRVRLASYTGTGPAITAGDVDANWEAAETVGDEAPGGDNPTPDQDVVDEIGKALGVEYDDDEELQGGDEIAARDHDRWELDPASSDDFDER